MKMHKPMCKYGHMPKALMNMYKLTLMDMHKPMRNPESAKQELHSGIIYPHELFSALYTHYRERFLSIFCGGGSSACLGFWNAVKGQAIIQHIFASHADPQSWGAMSMSTSMSMSMSIDGVWFQMQEIASGLDLTAALATTRIPNFCIIMTQT
jgi:hypothetical protein